MEYNVTLFMIRVWIVSQFVDFKWKNSKLQSYISRWELQFIYKNHIHLSLYEKVIIFLRSDLVTPVGVTWQDCTVTQVGVPWQSWHVNYALANPFQTLWSVPTWQTLSRQCVWRDIVFFFHTTLPGAIQKGYICKYLFGGLFLK